MSSLNRFYIRFTWGRGWKEVFLWLLYPVIHRRVGKHARTHRHGLIFAPCHGLVYHFSNAKIFFDLYSKCNMQSPLRQLTEHQSSIVFLIKMRPPPPKNSLRVFPLSSHSLFMDRPLDSARRKSSGLKRDRTSNCTHSAIVFQSVGSCGVLADCLLRKSLGCNRKT